jgi:hypothetical protein
MAGSVEKAALRLARELRSGRHVCGIITTLACVAIAQSLLVVHRIDHASTGHQVSCALCLAADHLPGAGEQPSELPVAPTIEPIEFVAWPSVSVELALPYQSRAPPGV